VRIGRNEIKRNIPKQDFYLLKKKKRVQAGHVKIQFSHNG